MPIATVCGLMLAATVPGAATSAAGSMTIQVTSVTLKCVEHDIAPKGASKGDTVVCTDRLLNAAVQFGKKKGAVVGSDSGTMTFAGPHTAKFQGTASLPGGTLKLDGNVQLLANGGLAIPVAGGSGKFAQASGTLTVGAGSTRVLNTYVLALGSLPVA